MTFEKGEYVIFKDPPFRDKGKIEVLSKSSRGWWLGFMEDRHLIAFMEHEVAKLPDKGSTLMEVTMKKLPLSPREIEVMVHASDGYTSREIAGLLKVSKRTVDNHFDNIYHKFNVDNRIRALAHFRKMFEGKAA